MSYYVTINRLNGRNDFFELAERLYDNRYVNVEYYAGGWSDHTMVNEAPCLVFEEELEAVAYVLKFGGKLYNSIPLIGQDVK